MTWKRFTVGNIELSDVWDNNRADVMLNGGVPGFTASYDISGVPGEDSVYIYSEGDYLPINSVVIRGVGVIPESNTKGYLANVGKGFIAKYIVPYLTQRYEGEGVAEELGVDITDLGRRFSDSLGADDSYIKFVEGGEIEPIEFDEGRSKKVY